MNALKGAAVETSGAESTQILLKEKKKMLQIPFCIQTLWLRKLPRRPRSESLLCRSALFQNEVIELGKCRGDFWDGGRKG